MSSGLKASDAIFKKLMAASERRLEMCDIIQKMFSSFSQSYLAFIDDFSLFLTDIQAQIDDTECTTIEKEFTEWAFHYIANYDPNKVFITVLQKEIVAPFTKHRSKYSSHIKEFESRYHTAKKKLTDTVSAYNEEYKKYTSHCEQIEKAGEAAMKDPTRQGDLDKVRGECYEIEKKAIEACDEVGRAQRSFQLSLEEIMLDYENVERDFFSKVQECLYHFSELCDKLAGSTADIATAARAKLDALAASIHDPTDILSPRKVSTIVDTFSDVPVLSFDIFDYLPWKTVFYNELHSTFMTVMCQFSNPSSDYLTVEAGEIVKVIKVQGSSVVIESDNCRVKGKIPSTFLKSNKAYKRKVYRVEEDHAAAGCDELSIKKGQYVCWISDDGTRAKCKTAAGAIGYLPLAILTLMEKKK